MEIGTGYLKTKFKLKGEVAELISGLLAPSNMFFCILQLCARAHTQPCTHTPCCSMSASSGRAALHSSIAAPFGARCAFPSISCCAHSPLWAPAVCCAPLPGLWVLLAGPEPFFLHLSASQGHLLGRAVAAAVSVVC